MVDLHRCQTLDSSCLKRVGTVGEHFSLPIQTAGTSGPIVVCRPGLDPWIAHVVLLCFTESARRSGEKQVLPNPAGATLDSRHLGWRERSSFHWPVHSRISKSLPCLSVWR